MDKKTGIGVYTLDVLKAIRNQYTNVSTISNKRHYSNDIVINYSFPFFKTYGWINYLPYKLKGASSDVLFNTNGIPHFFPFKSKEVFFVYDLSWLTYPETHPLSRVLFYKLLFPMTLKRSYRIVTISEFSKNDLIKYYGVNPKNIFIVNPIFEPTANEGLKPNNLTCKKFILHVGTLEPRKNLHRLIKAYARLVHNGYLHHLVFAGKKGWMYDNLFEEVKRLGIEEEVEFLGYVSSEEKTWLYKNAVMTAYPSLYEGFGIPALEAMGHGSPCMVSNVSSLPEIVGNATLKVNPLSEDEIYSGMKALLDQKELRNELSKKGIIRAKHFGPNLMKQQIRTLLQSFDIK